MKNYKDYWYTSHDGLRLYARDYTLALDKKPQAKTILCMHGLTRNSADFEDICAELADDYRLIVVDQRGRGLSDYDPNYANYNPLVYVQDMFTLLEALKLPSVILLGTSLGGIMAMIMTSMKPNMIEAIIINDVGPEIAEKGLERLKKYVGKQTPVTTWDEAAKQSAFINEIAFPEADEEFWMKFAKRLYKEDEKGCPVLNHDLNIAIPLIEDTKENSAAPDLWPVYDLILDKPMLLIRGALSDIIDVECVQRMQLKKPDIEFFEIPKVGHAPILSEDGVAPVIKNFLSKL